MASHVGAFDATRHSITLHRWLVHFNCLPVAEALTTCPWDHLVRHVSFLRDYATSHIGRVAHFSVFLPQHVLPSLLYH